MRGTAPRTLIIAAITALAVWAVVEQLRRPANERTWHGELAGFIPYDFRAPTLDRVLAAYWNPDDPRLFTGQVIGIGWSVNLPTLLRRLSEAGIIGRR